MLMATFRREQRLARRAYLLHLQITFDSEIAEGRASCDELVFFPTESECIAEAWENYLFEHIMQFDEDQAHLLVSFRSSLTIEPQHPDNFDRVLSLARTAALWSGLRRVYFGEREIDSPPAQDMVGLAPDLPHDQAVTALRAEITMLQQRAAAARQLDSVPPDDGRPPLPFRRDEDDDSPPSGRTLQALLGSTGVPVCSSGGASEGSSLPSKPHGDDGGSQLDASVYFYGSTIGAFISPDLSDQNEMAHDAGSQSEVSVSFSGPNESTRSFYDAHGNAVWATPRSLIHDPYVVSTPPFDHSGGSSMSSLFSPRSPRSVALVLSRVPVFLTRRVFRRIMAAKESIFKYGTFVPKNDREAESSPEAARWKAGRDLEWMRLEQHGTFDGDWTWDKVREAFPLYQRTDVGFLFYVYDFKFSGEHRVRLVFDGSRQSASTYSETYAPTVRAESVRLFHIVCVEEGYHIGQYDVPQAFLKANIDHDIFAYPPKGQGLFPGQILKLRRALYGGKQSAFLWFQMMNLFLLELGFTPSPLDACFYRRSDAILILYCDDLRIGASSEVLSALHESFLGRFEVTTAPGNRFLGMDTVHDLDAGYLKLSMSSYIEMTVDRFKNFDLRQGFPFREIVGCLLWITLGVMGPELLRVKDLARKSNSFNEADYRDSLKVLDRIYARRKHGIVIYRNAAGRELVPASSRPPKPGSILMEGPPPDVGTIIDDSANELTHQALCKGKAFNSSFLPLTYSVDDADNVDLQRVLLPVNSRYSLVVFADASFAVGATKQSVTGYVVFLNGSPLLWGSLKQTIVVDSSCSAEFVAASVACKQLIHAENMVGFLGFSCPKPYRMYTDSMACLHIATNPARLGNVRHLQIRYHLVRCYVCLGDVAMYYCITEEMIADLLTKIVSGAQDQRLSLRFYSLFPGSDKMVLGAVVSFST
jgi:hypothetical protein